MQTKKNIFIKTVGKSLIVILVPGILWFITIDDFTLLDFILMVLPHHAVWLGLTALSIVNRGEPFLVFTLSTIADKRHSSDWNYRYSAPFLICFVAIVALQIYFDLV